MTRGAEKSLLSRPVEVKKANGHTRPLIPQSGQERSDYLQRRGRTCIRTKVRPRAEVREGQTLCKGKGGSHHVRANKVRKGKEHLRNVGEVDILEDQ